MPIQGFPGYEVSNLGRIRSFVTPGNKTFKIKTISIDRNKRSKVNLHNKGYIKNACVPILVLETFIGLRPVGTECCHNNGNSSDNQLDNLRWDTHKENEKDKLKHGTALIGNKCPWSKLTEEQVRCIKKRLLNNEHCRIISKDYNVSPTTIYSIKINRNWKQVII